VLKFYVTIVQTSYIYDKIIQFNLRILIRAYPPYS